MPLWNCWSVCLQQPCEDCRIQPSTTATSPTTDTHTAKEHPKLAGTPLNLSIRLAAMRCNLKHTTRLQTLANWCGTVLWIVAMCGQATATRYVYGPHPQKQAKYRYAAGWAQLADWSLRLPACRHLLQQRPIAGCGTAWGSCNAGYCCSEWGFCGDSADHCNARCQVAYSSAPCGPAPVPDAASPSPAFGEAWPVPCTGI